ncbi:hypothetical protein IKG10_00110 [Candidatus Saccharibacteria bacterium]|nr:hypothetical protein [Candidatus Saccharibacteria bacterium]
MFLFGYEHESGMVCPTDDEVRRVMIFREGKNNVLVWRGYDGSLTQYTIDKEALWEIEGLLEEQSELTDAEKSGKEYLYPLDVPEDTFAFVDNEGRYRIFSDAMLSCEKGKDAGIDAVIDFIFKIQGILKKNGVDVVMLTERDLDNTYEQ